VAVSGSHEHQRADGASAPRPGTLTGLLEELAGSPGAATGEGWEQGLRPGAVVGRFELVRELGRGGFGVVWEARDRELMRPVAFKAVRAGGRAGLREERLLREAEAAARLSHPNIVTLHDVGRCEWGPYLVLELLRGQTLAGRLSQGPVPLREALRIGVEVARGVAHAHAEGVVHRDLKPGNVFLCQDGQVKVLDFGLAHALGIRRADGGTPAYMAPEQWRGAPEDERTDVFALGVLLFRMLAGELPFPEDDEGRAVLSPRRAPGLEVPEVPALGALVGRMLEKDPTRRPRDGGEVLAALSAFHRELDRSPSTPSAPVRMRRRRLVPLLALGLVAGVALAAAAGAYLRWRGPAETEPRERIAVAVADFANQTGEPELDGLSGMLITSLEQSRRLSVLTRARMLDLLRQMGKGSVAAVDEGLGREMALGAGVRALVLASIRRFDQLYAIELKVLDPVANEYLFTLKDQGQGKASVPGMIDRLSEQTRERLSETPAELQASRVRVADVTTDSFEAYQHYFRGDQLKEAIRYEQAIEEYRKAIAIDPTFALPHYRIAYLGLFTGLDEAERRAEMEAALRNVDRVPPKERLLFQAWKAHMDGRDDEAHALYARVAESFPQDKEALFMAGDLYLHTEKPAEALPWFERAVALDPAWEPAMMHVVDSLAMLGRNEELMRRARAWVEKAPSASSYRALAMAHVATGRPEEGVEAARRALELDGTGYSRGSLAEALILAERYEEAEALVRPFAGPAASRFDRMHTAKALVAAVSYQGRRREARRIVEAYPEEPGGKEHVRRIASYELAMGDGKTGVALREARALAQGESVEGKQLALSLVLLGDPEAGARVASKLPAGVERSQYQAALAWRSGRREEALSALRALAKRPEMESRGLSLWLLAQVALEAGNASEAVAAVEALRKTPAGLWRSWALPQSLYLEAVASERLGDRDRAAQTLDRLLAIWKKADPDLPFLAEARAMRRRLGGRL
jgi:tetratricopeptide (TPR) repeat protein